MDERYHCYYSNTALYFAPQLRTKIMNEGWKALA